VPEISRRDVLAGVSCAALLGVSGLGAAAFAQGRPLSGRLCLGLGGLTYFSGFYPFLNIWLQGAAIRITDKGVVHHSDNPPGTPNSAWDGYLDAKGELVNPFPRSVTAVSRLFFATPTDGFAVDYSQADEDWVLKWAGTAGQVSIYGVGKFARADGRATWRWPAKREALEVTFARIDPTDPPRNIRLCLAAHEPLLDSGEIFNPAWLQIVRQGSGLIRFLDWQGTNNNRSTLRFTDIPGMDHVTYGGSTGTRSIKGGVPLEIASRLAKEVESHPWICIPSILGTPDFSALPAIGNSNPALVKAPGHQWKDGDVVIPYGTNWPNIERKRLTVSNSDRQAGTFTLTGVDATGFEAFNSGWASLTAPYDLAAIRSEVSAFAAHFRDTVDAPLLTYFEFGNELWNWIFNAPHWLAAQAQGQFDGDNYKMSGYLAAHCMNVIRETYGQGNRLRWRGVLATFTVLTDVTNRMIAGVNAYLEDHASSLTLRDLFDDLAVTGYWGPGFTEETKEQTFALIDTSEARWKEGSEPTKYSHFNKVINQQCAASLEDMKGFWQQQKAVADAHGLGFIQYEGGNHNEPRFAATLTQEELGRFMAFYKNCNHTAEDAMNYKAMFEAFTALGGKYPAKFVEMGPVSRYGAWGGLRHMRDSNPVWAEVVAFNQRS
jgi:hypothetical protein